MKEKPARTKEELSKVLLYPNSTGPDISYWMFEGVSIGRNQKWENITIVPPGNYGGEFIKTYGHYHTQQVLETYKLLHGKGVFFLQEKFIDNGKWVQEKVKNVYLVEVTPEEEIVVKPEFAHSWINLGNEPLITLDDWRVGHTKLDYDPLTKLRGMSYYLVEKGNTPQLVPNPNYKELPKPQWLNVSKFNSIINL